MLSFASLLSQRASNVVYIHDARTSRERISRFDCLTHIVLEDGDMPFDLLRKGSGYIDATRGGIGFLHISSGMIENRIDSYSIVGNLLGKRACLYVDGIGHCSVYEAEVAYGGKGNLTLLFYGDTAEKIRSINPREIGFCIKNDSIYLIEPVYIPQ